MYPSVTIVKALINQPDSNNENVVLGHFKAFAPEKRGGQREVQHDPLIDGDVIALERSQRRSAIIPAAHKYVAFEPTHLEECRCRSPSVADSCFE